MLTQLGKKLLAVNFVCAGLGVLEYYAYYSMAPSIIKANFEATPLKSEPNLAEPVLIIHEETKFVFAHRGGEKAVEAILKDNFGSNKIVNRAVVLQYLTIFSIDLGVLKNRMFLMPVSAVAILANFAFVLPIVYNTVGVYNLSVLVKQGNEEVWENLNEARYVQKMEEIYSPILYYSRLFGIYASFACITYFSPLMGFCVFCTSKTFGLHNRYN